MQLIADINGKVTETQIVHLWRLIYKCRKQIMNASFIVAETIILEAKAKTQ